MHRRLLVVIPFLLLAISAGAVRGEKRVTEKEGQWSKKTYEVSGGWTIVREGEARYLELSDSFKTKQGPDLKIFLSPRALADVSGSSATKGSIRLGRLGKHKGKQRIALAADIDLSKYKSILIHCEKYAVVFAGASLK